MEAKELPARPSLEQYKKQAKELVKGLKTFPLSKSGDHETIQRIMKQHPRLVKLSEAKIRGAEFALADAQLVIAREHGFESWPKFAKHVEALTRANSSVSQFELAADAVVHGDVVTLRRHGAKA